MDLDQENPSVEQWYFLKQFIYIYFIGVKFKMFPPGAHGIPRLTNQVELMSSLSTIFPNLRSATPTPPPHMVGQEGHHAYVITRFQ